VEKQVPIGENSQRKSIYTLNDNMFRFWYRYVLPNMAFIEAGAGNMAYKNKVKPLLNEYMGEVFEQCAIQYMWRRNISGLLPFTFTQIGRWWGNNLSQRRQGEIDFIAVSGNKAIFGECKWRNEAQGIGVLKSLIDKSQILKIYKEKHYMIFSMSGFTKGLNDEAANIGNVELVTIDMMF
jgi:uncharacterized protein